MYILNSFSKGFRKTDKIANLVRIEDINEAPEIEELHNLNLLIKDVLGSDVVLTSEDLHGNVGNERRKVVYSYLAALSALNELSFVPAGPIVSPNFFDDDDFDPDSILSQLRKDTTSYVVKGIKKKLGSFVNEYSRRSFSNDLNLFRRDAHKLNNKIRSKLGNKLFAGSNFEDSEIRFDIPDYSYDSRSPDGSYSVGISEDTKPFTIELTVKLGYIYQSLDQLSPGNGTSYLHFTYGKLQIPTSGPVFDFISKNVQRMLLNRFNVEMRERYDALVKFDIKKYVDFLNEVWLSYQIYYSLDSFSSYFYGGLSNRNDAMLDIVTRFPKILADAIPRFKGIIQQFPLPAIMNQYAFFMSGNYLQSKAPASGMCKTLPFAMGMNTTNTFDMLSVANELDERANALLDPKYISTIRVLELLKKNEVFINSGDNKYEATITPLYSNPSVPLYNEHYNTCFVNYPLVYKRSADTFVYPETDSYDFVRMAYSTTDNLKDNVMPILLSSCFNGNGSNSFSHNFFQPIAVLGAKGELSNKFSVCKGVGNNSDKLILSSPVNQPSLACLRSETFSIYDDMPLISPFYGREEIKDLSYTRCKKYLEVFIMELLDLERFTTSSPKTKRPRDKKKNDKFSKFKDRKPKTFKPDDVGVNSRDHNDKE